MTKMSASSLSLGMWISTATAVMRRHPSLWMALCTSPPRGAKFSPSKPPLAKNSGPTIQRFLQNAPSTPVATSSIAALPFGVAKFFLPRSMAVSSLSRPLLGSPRGKRSPLIATTATPSRAPRVVTGKVLIGNGGSEYGVRGYISAYDADTGKMAWRFYTVPGDPAKPFEAPILEKAAKTWTGRWWNVGGGGTVWDSISYDPELDLVYFGVGN